MSAETFLKDYKAYFVDQELTEYDEQRLLQIFSSNAEVVSEKVVEKVVRVVEKQVHYVAVKHVFIDTQTNMRYDDIGLLPSVNINALIERVISDAARVWGVRPEHVIGPIRKRNYVNARFFVVLKLKEYNMTYSEIARRLGCRDHTTIIQAHKAANDLLNTNHEPFCTLWEAFKRGEIVTGSPLHGVQEAESIVNVS